MTGTFTIPVDFGQEYHAVREKEGRLYSDEELLYLPQISRHHPHYGEWKLRKESCDRLREYLKKKGRKLAILDIGCGNGWLSHRLAGIPGCEVTGLDTGIMELEQARRVFSHIPCLRFIHGSIGAKEIEKEQFDMVVFAASLQYFSSLAGTISMAQDKLKPGGEIHILDTAFYDNEGREKARQHTRRYYTGLGFPGMAAYYFHHGTEELKRFHYKTLYQPSFFRHHLLQNRNPFPWVCIKNNDGQ
jgi:cyclopropane fatty-acyl-phospholipid synthase-like methyltransferase